MEGSYKILRNFFFWFFVISFAICVPLVVFYSLGYKYNPQLKYFQKTGIITIKTIPASAEVYLDNKNIKKTTPTAIKELLPGSYNIRIEKDGFYPYQTTVKVNQSAVSEVNVILIPKIEDVEKINFEENFYKFFIIEHIFGKRILAIAEDKIYLLNEELEEISRIVSKKLADIDINSFYGFKESKGNVVLWNQNSIWFIDANLWNKKDKELDIECVYKTAGPIKNVFFVLKDRYLVIHDDLKILALDLKTKVTFELYKLNSSLAEIYCDSYYDLFIKDEIAEKKKFSLLKINLSKKIYERTKN